MSKQEIRRAARDAFPKAKRSSTAKKYSTGGAYTKRNYTAGGQQTGGRNVPKPPSLVRSIVVGVGVGILFFVVIQWLWRQEGVTTNYNLVTAAVGTVLFACVNYLTESIRYRRYMRKHDGSSQ